MTKEEFQNLFCDILPIINKAAPSIGSLIGSSSTNIILGLLGAIAQINPCKPQEISEALKRDPDLYIKLANLEQSHAEWLMEHK